MFYKLVRNTVLTTSFNFLFSVEPNGSITAYTCDDLRQCLAVDVESILSQS